MMAETSERTIQIIHADDAENTIRDVFAQQPASDVLMHNLPRRLKYEDRLENTALTWFGFVHNQFELRTNNKTETRKKRTMHFLDQLYGAGKTRFCIELITQLNTRFEEIWQLVYKHAIMQGFNDKEDLDFTLDTLTQYKNATYIGIPTPFARNRTVEALYSALLMEIVVKCGLADKAFSDASPSALFHLIVQALPYRCIVLHIDEVTHAPSRTSVLLHACTNLEESAADYGLRISIILSGRGTGIPLVRYLYNNLTI
jgi:hypothetical protein